MLIDDNLKLLASPSGITIQGITSAEEQRILNFLQGAIYAHCFYKPDCWFCIWDFLGGVNGDWQDTPLQRLYDIHNISNGKNSDDTQKCAGKDAGLLLKKAIIEEPRRIFVTKKDVSEITKPRQYKWVK